ncbi:MAG: UDP-3-O-acyl-N-acetylglucosamine deacetylase [Rickettsiales bacterium]|nr:UDP-3-O-acyl-N-acetylglucosamine deacetylase [Rickettsiales bacterium]
MILKSQKTINSKISCKGIGVHSGKNASITFYPAPTDTGIIFRRTDFDKDKSHIRAKYDNVIGTNLGTSLINKHGAKVSTVEHLMAAIWGCGIDNLYIDISGEEIPIMDGSSEPFIFLFECAGIKTQNQPRKVIEILQTIRVEEDDKFAQVRPSKDFSIELEVEFSKQKIAKQKFIYNPESTSFKNDISRARTFGFKHEIEALHKMNLAKGGSLDNAIVIDNGKVINKEGLRYENELVRHKALDFVGDVYLSGYFIIGAFKAYKTGHKLNNMLMHELFSNKDNYRII